MKLRFHFQKNEETKTVCHSIYGNTWSAGSTFLFFMGKTMMILSEQGSTVSIDNVGSTVNLSEDDFPVLRKI